MSSGSEILPLKRVLLKHVRDAFRDHDAVECQWRTLGYSAPPDFRRALYEYERFVSLLADFGIELQFLPAAESEGLDSIYVRDASLACDEGVILCNMGKAARESEPAAHERALRGAGVRVIGSIDGAGRLEGGDAIWLGARTLAVGQGYRTNAEGIRQLQVLLDDLVDRLIVVPLPHWRGPQDVFHLMSMVSPIDRDVALVYSPLLPVPFREELLALGYELIEVPEEEFGSLGCNVLTVAPRTCVMLSGNPQTRTRLERAGVEVHEFRGAEICVKGAGGPTCLTRPLSREP